MEPWLIRCPFESLYIKATAEAIKKRARHTMIFTAKEFENALIAFKSGRLEDDDFVVSWTSFNGTNGVFIDIRVEIP